MINDSRGVTNECQMQSEQFSIRDELPGRSVLGEEMSLSFVQQRNLPLTYRCLNAVNVKGYLFFAKMSGRPQMFDISVCLEL